MLAYIPYMDSLLQMDCDSHLVPKKNPRSRRGTCPQGPSGCHWVHRLRQCDWRSWVHRSSDAENCQILCILFIYICIYIYIYMMSSNVFKPWENPAFLIVSEILWNPSFKTQIPVLLLHKLVAKKQKMCCCSTLVFCPHSSTSSGNQAKNLDDVPICTYENW